MDVHRSDAGPATGPATDLVTGAFGNVGSVIAARLAADGRRVRTLTDHPASGPEPGPDRGGEQIDVRPHAWDYPDLLAEAFEGVTTFYNTYWMRLGDADGRYETATDRCIQLIDAAARAGVERIVHISVAHPSADSPYPYFRGKAAVEAHLARTGVPWAAVRPALVFGGDSVLLNNLAWMLRRLPVFGLAGGGHYRVRPVHIDDLAQICVEAGARQDDETIDAVGPERPTFRQLVTDLRDAIGARTRLVGLPAGVVLPTARVLGKVIGDDLLSRDELLSTLDGLADTTGPATGPTGLSTWLAEHGAELGHGYINERGRRGR